MGILSQAITRRQFLKLSLKAAAGLFLISPLVDLLEAKSVYPEIPYKPFTASDLYSRHFLAG